MSQQKAASLTSSLFARKGKASPASLLISELDSVSAGGAVPAATKAAANGSARRKPKTSAELPLLAFVEAQVDAEVGTDLGAAEPAPAASLLERGARSLRRADERHLAPEEQAGVIEVPEAADSEVGMAESETVSGDANVAAIEDAPPEEPGDDGVSADAAVVIAAPDQVVEASVIVDATPVPEVADTLETVAPETATSETSAPEADTSEADTAVGIAPRDAKTDSGSSPAVAAKEAAAGAGETPLPTGTGILQESAAPTVAAVALRPAAGRSPAAAPSRGPAPHSPPSQGLWWRSAAVVTLGVALGFGAYLTFSGTPGQSPTVEAVQEVEVPADDGEALPAAVAAVPTADEAASAATPVAEFEAPEPSFDIIRIEPDGQSIIAGRALPFSEWILLNNGSPIATVAADANGEWIVLPGTALVPGANDFSLVPKTERGRVAIPAPLAEPDGDGGSSVAPQSDLHRIEGETQGNVDSPPGTAPVEAPLEAPAVAVVLPKPKPASAATAMQTTMTEAFRVSRDGGYEVQVASVRQDNDAQRERDRLEGAYPDLLGRLDLRVQEASVEGAGTFYRVRTGAIGDLGVARELCRRLETRGQGCLVVRSDVEAPAPESATELVEDLPAEPAASAAGQQAERPQ
jgi:hypothetical protein